MDTDNYYTTLAMKVLRQNREEQNNRNAMLFMYGKYSWIFVFEVLGRREESKEMGHILYTLASQGWTYSHDTVFDFDPHSHTDNKGRGCRLSASPQLESPLLGGTLSSESLHLVLGNVFIKGPFCFPPQPVKTGLLAYK